MALRGDLASVDLAQVFQMLALNQKVGLLFIQSSTSWKALFFNENGVTLYFNEHTMLDRVLAKLVRGGQISANGVLEAREHAAHQGHQVVDGLLAGGYLTEEELDTTVSTEIEEEIYELFFWHDAKFEFYEGATECPGREGVIHDQFFFGTDAVIMEAARRIDEWGYIHSLVPSTEEVYQVASTDARAYDLADELFQVFELMDGMRSVERVVEVTGQPSFHVHKTICALLEEEVIQAVPPESFIDIGKDCMAEGRTQDAINLFERAVEAGEGLPEVHTLAAEAYRVAGEFERSSEHVKCMAEYHAANGNLKKATHLFREVLETIPTDLAACQRVVELSIDHPELGNDDFDPLNVGKDLVDLYLEMGEVSRVRSLLEELIREHPADIELKRSLINVHTKVGDTKRVIELYESIAEDLTKNGDPIEAIKYLQKILQLNRARTDISEWIKRLYQVDERQRSRRRSIMALGAVFGLLVLASVGYYFYNKMARAELEGIGVQSLMREQKFSEARSKVTRFIESYPFTVAVSDAREELLHITGIEEEAVRASQVAERAARKRLQQLQFEYKSEWQLHRTHFEHSELERSLKRLETVRGLVKKAGTSADFQWAAQKKIEKNYKDLLDYLTNAMRLDREARRAKDDGDWESHRKLVLDLVTNYELADVARRTEISVLFVTRPEGAIIYQNGRPLTVLIDGDVTPMRTPAIVLCPNKRKVHYELRKAGFDPLSVALNPRVTGSVRSVMSIQPVKSIKFGPPALDGPGVSRDGKVVVGLRGGKIGISVNGVDHPRVRKLDGLRDLHGVPATNSTHAFFRTNQGEVVCHRLADGEQEWSKKIRSPLTQDPVIANNRLYLVDRDGNIRCLSASEGGKELWSRQLKGAIAGRPTTSGRYIAVGSQLGTVLVLDVSGRVETRLQLDVGVTTAVHLNKGLLVFGTEDGQLQAYRRGTVERAWSVDVQRAIRDGEMTMSNDRESVFIVGAKKSLRRISLLDGSVMVERRMAHRPRSGLLMMDNNLIVVLQVLERQQNQSTKQWDVMLALDPKTFETEWRFSDGGNFQGRPARGSKRLYLTGSKGEVHRVK